MFCGVTRNVKLAKWKSIFQKALWSVCSILELEAKAYESIEQLEMKRMLRIVPSVVFHCVNIKVRELIFVYVRETLRGIVIDVNVWRQLELMTLNCVEIFPVGTLLIELVEVIIEVRVLLGVRIEYLRCLLNLPFTRSVLRHVVEPTALCS